MNCPKKKEISRIMNLDHVEKDLDIENIHKCNVSEQKKNLCFESSQPSTSKYLSRNETSNLHNDLVVRKIDELTKRVTKLESLLLAALQTNNQEISERPTNVEIDVLQEANGISNMQTEKVNSLDGKLSRNAIEVDDGYCVIETRMDGVQQQSGSSVELPTCTSEDKLQNIRAEYVSNEELCGKSIDFVGFDDLRKQHETNLLTENRNRITLLTNAISLNRNPQQALEQVNCEEYQSVDDVLNRWESLDKKMKDCLDNDALKQKTIMEVKNENRKLTSIVYAIYEYLNKVTPSLSPSLEQVNDVNLCSGGYTSLNTASRNAINFQVTRKRKANSAEALKNKEMKLSNTNSNVKRKDDSFSKAVSSTHNVPHVALIRKGIIADTRMELNLFDHGGDDNQKASTIPIPYDSKPSSRHEQQFVDSEVEMKGSCQKEAVDGFSNLEDRKMHCSEENDVIDLVDENTNNSPMKTATGQDHISDDSACLGSTSKGNEENRLNKMDTGNVSVLLTDSDMSLLKDFN